MCERQRIDSSQFTDLNVLTSCTKAPNILGDSGAKQAMSGYLTCLFKALAMDLTMLVLPTPGEPWKHKMLCLVVLPAYLKPWLWI